MIRSQIVFLALALNAATFAAVEPWADKRLEPPPGLTMWFDVSRQNAARGQERLSPLQSWSDAPDILLDGSGHKNHLLQPLLEARPRFRQEFSGAMLQFDGTNDFLSLSGLKKSLEECSIFVVAAPRTVGAYRALLAFNELGRNDYTTGLNLDFGSSPAAIIARINAEGAGFSGEANLLRNQLPLGSWHLISLIGKRGRDGVKLFIDEKEQAARERAGDSILKLEDFTLGARKYSNTPSRPHVQGYFQGELSEVLLFDRALTDKERASVETYLQNKYGALIRGGGGLVVKEGVVPLMTVTNPPPVQVHFPGFSARELPVDLSNINNVRYRPDGKLLAVGYDGNIWLLSDTNGDGVEDKAEPWWNKESLRAPIGAALTPPNYARGDGVFVSAKDKLVLIVDTNKDDRADQEITVATWTERSEQQGVDALGVAVAPDGTVYFSLGTTSFTEPYLMDRTTGQARYRTTMERGTIQKVSPDFSKRETVCTGIRFAVGMAFNKEGDLFCTDQEGATWVPNGNPFDELLHIQPGRHYGFPARHPRHLPDVIDEPSVFDYAPQHESTCGLQFNRSSDGQGIFGPNAWADEAIVAGYSRGKLWRTKLVKTESGCVAQSHLFATLQALTVDACVSPKGSLVVATHSGFPDWGSGPKGKGKLWQIAYEDHEEPQPVAAWNASSTELKVAFDRPLRPEHARELPKHARLESGKYVVEGDRFETIRPGYQVVYDQIAAPRYVNEILSVQISPDQRTLTFLTRPRSARMNYVIDLPWSSSNKTILPETSIRTDLNGLNVTWSDPSGKEQWQGWLPHSDLAVAREFTRGSSEHEQFFSTIQKKGALTLNGQLDLYQMLQPAIQPGSMIDWDRPSETVQVHVTANAPFELSVGTLKSNSKPDGITHKSTLEIIAPGQKWQPFQLRLAAIANPQIQISWSTSEDNRLRAFPLRRFLLPWAEPDGETNTPAERPIPEIAGGNSSAGKTLFFSDKLACAKCHSIAGEGGKIAPDLSNLIYRDYASVQKDIQFPSAALNPDHIASIIELKDGEPVSGIIQNEEKGKLYIAIASGQVQEVARGEVLRIKPSEISLMPAGLWDGMSLSERRDLMTFLLTRKTDEKQAVNR